MQIQFIGVLVGGRHQHHTEFEQSLQQPTHEHGVANIGNVELVQA